MKTAIFYFSKHHGNTKKILDAIATKYDVDLIDSSQQQPVDISQYDRIGLASGIYVSKFGKAMYPIVESLDLAGKEYFLIYTYGMKRSVYGQDIREIADKSGGRFVGEYGCLGWDTVGPLKAVGGIAKNHPDDTEIAECVRWYASILPESQIR